MLSNLGSDLRYAARTFRRSPGFAVAAIAPIALGIGINTGIFSILNSFAFRQLPTPAAAELVSVHQEFQGVPVRIVHGARSMFSIPEYRMYRDRTQTLSGVMAYSLPWTVTLGGGEPREVEVLLVTCNYFDVLRLPPSVGNGFAPNCDAPNAPPQAVLSHALWTRDFNGDRDIVGKSITLNGHDVTVAGVAPQGFDGTDIMKAALFAPTSLVRLVRPEENFSDNPQASWLTIVGRRKSGERGADLARVRAELAVVAKQIDQQQPGRTTTLTVGPATSLSLPEGRRVVFSGAAIILAAFGLVLLIACANVGNLLLARAAGRTREIAVRLSLGASRGRLIQQLLTESAVVAVAGGAIGSLLAWWSFNGILPVLLSSLPGPIPPLRVDATPNLTVLWFALGLTAATTLVFGMAPALQASKPDVQAALKQEGAIAGRRTAGWLRGSLLAAQVAICVLLLTSAGLLLRALYGANTVNPGFDYRHVVVASLDLQGQGSDEQAAIFQRQLMEQVAALPGVDATAQASKTPLSPGRYHTVFHLPGQDHLYSVDWNDVSPGYFSVIGIPIVRGRTFTTADLVASPRVAIVTEATARRYWPGQDPVGQMLAMSRGQNEETPLEVVGVAKDAEVTVIGETASSYLYLPAGPRAQRGLDLLLRSRTEFAGLAASIRAVARGLNPGVVVRVNPLEANLDFWRSLARLIATVSGSLSILAVALASVGVYGVVAYVVSRRRREVGIRMALGATGRDVERLIIGQTLRPVAIGLLIGLAAAAAASRVLQSVLFGVSPFDPIAFLGAPLFLMVIALAAALLPTRAALRVDPIATLRYE